MSVKIITADCRDALKTLPDESVHCVVTSPPYFGLRDYGVEGQLGLEPTPSEFVAALTDVFREIRRVLRPNGTVWLNLGDSYANDGKWGGSSGGKHVTALHGNTNVGRGKVSTGLKPKDLIGIPWRVAFALQEDGWYLRQDIIWEKPNPMPESVKDRCTKAHEYLFMLTKSATYHYDASAVAEDAVSTNIKKFTDGGADKERGHGRRHAGVNGRYAQSLADNGVPKKRNRRSVWRIPTRPFPDAHFATFPVDIPDLCIRAGCPPGGTVLDPFGGAGTTGLAACRLGRDAIIIELNPDYAAMARRRIEGDQQLQQTEMF